MPKRNKPTPWTLCPGDLPPADVIAREPRLAGLEDNAFFRLLMWKKHLSTPVAHAKGLSLFLVSFVCSYYASKYTSFVYIIFIIASINLYVFFRYKKHPEKKIEDKLADLLNMNPENIRDLYMARFYPNDIVQAFWGAYIHNWSKIEISLIILAQAVGLLIFLLIYEPYQIIWFAVYIGFGNILLGCWAFNSRLPERGLHGAYRKLAKVQGLKPVKRPFFYESLITLLVTINLYGIFAPNSAPPYDPVASIIASVIIGALLGFLMGRRQRLDMIESATVNHAESLVLASNLLTAITEYVHAEKK